MNLSNKLTMLRIILTFIFMLFLFIDGLFAKIAALVIFILAVLTDILDGWLARRRGEITDFGKFMDPVADKILVLGAFFAFIELKLVPAWMVVLILFRELVITGLRLSALTKKVIIPASEGGKHKTASQMAAIFIILSFLILREVVWKVPNLWNPAIASWYYNIIYIVMFIATTLTLISGASYLYKNQGILTNAQKNH